MKRKARLGMLLLATVAVCWFCLRTNRGDAPGRKGPEAPAAVSGLRWAKGAGIAPIPPSTHSYRQPRAATNGVAGASGQETADQRAAPVCTDAIPGEFIVRFRSQDERDAFVRMAAGAGIEVLGVMPFGNAVLIRVKDRGRLDALLGQVPPIVDIGENYYVRTPPLQDPAREMPDGQYTGFGSQALKWLGVSGDTSRWGADVLVAVLDTAVLQHPSLAEARVSRLDLLGLGQADHPNPHGTAVSSLIAGSEGEVSGLAPAAKVLGIRVADDDGVGNSFAVARGIVEAADRGAKVINLCLGTHGDSALLHDAVRYACAHGAVVVATAGNDGIEGLTYPAAYEEALAVAAVDASGRHVYFSNRGAGVGIAAPGLGVTAASTNGATELFSGTSAAAPFVSGAIAMLLSQDVRMSGAEAVRVLEECADDQGSPGHDSEYGSGILSMRRVLQRGEGRMADVAAADATVVRDPSGDLLVTLSGQNRGTEDLYGVVMTIEGTSGSRQSATFYGVHVGQTVSHVLRVPVSEVAQTGRLDITWTMEIRGASDARPQDNTRRLTMSIPDRPQP
jgi:hypothetical protein